MQLLYIFRKLEERLNMLDRNMGHIFKHQNFKDEKSILDRIDGRVYTEEGKINNFET